MSDLVGKCGRYLWSEDIEPKSWIYNNYESFVAQHTLGRVYHCVDQEADCIVIEARKGERYKVDQEGFDTVSFTPFYIGDSVKILNGSKSGKSAIISGIGWHLKNKKAIYILEIEGKKSSRQYSESDFEPYEN